MSCAFLCRPASCPARSSASGQTSAVCHSTSQKLTGKSSWLGRRGGGFYIIYSGFKCFICEGGRHSLVLPVPRPSWEALMRPRRGTSCDIQPCRRNPVFQQTIGFSFHFFFFKLLTMRSSGIFAKLASSSLLSLPLMRRGRGPNS